MLSATGFCHLLLRQAVQPGDWCLDATAGNGHDTLFLARLAGPQGKVFAFDIQPQAIEATRRLLAENQIPPGICHLVQADHAAMAEHLPAEAAGRCSAVVFNLGYLPGSDKSLTTAAGSTLPALTSSLGFLKPGGLLLVVLYPGHATGKTEATLVRSWAAALPMKTAHGAVYETLNARRAAPTVLAITKSGNSRAEARNSWQDPISVICGK